MRKVIKAVSAKTYSVELLELKPDIYVVAYEGTGHKATVDRTLDLIHALKLFDDVLVLLQGN